MRLEAVPNLLPKSKKHPKCLGQTYHDMNGIDFDCGYNTIIDCEDCKYGLGKKDPEAKCNQEK